MSWPLGDGAEATFVPSPPPPLPSLSVPPEFPGSLGGSEDVEGFSLPAGEAPVGVSFASLLLLSLPAGFEDSVSALGEGGVDASDADEDEGGCVPDASDDSGGAAATCAPLSASSPFEGAAAPGEEVGALGEGWAEGWT